MQGQKKIFRVGSQQFRESPRELLRELWFSHHSANGISHAKNYFQNSESCSENTPELSQSSENGLFTQSVFPEIGVVPRLLILWREGKMRIREHKRLHSRCYHLVPVLFSVHGSWMILTAHAMFFSQALHSECGKQPWSQPPLHKTIFRPAS